MKKRVLALLFGGLIAVGSFVLQGSITAKASGDGLGSDGWKEWINNVSCDGYSDAHITSKEITAGGGQLKVAVGISYDPNDTPQLIEGSCGGGVCLCGQPWTPENGVGDGNTYYDYEEFISNANATKYFVDGVTANGITELTFDGLNGGQTYYVYCWVTDVHTKQIDYGQHYAVCLGTGTPTAGGSSSDSSASASSSSGSGESAWTSYQETVKNQIVTAQLGSTVVLEKGISAVSNSMMKELLAKGDVSLKLEFTYKDQEYVIIIPAGAALDNDIPWYGPLYLAEKFGNRAGTENTAVSNTTASATQETPAENPVSTVYEVHSGDTLSKIAAENHMTLSDLLAKNPQIKDPGRIRVGQQINL